MQNYQKIYMKAFGYEEGDFIPSEISGSEAIDIHHIDCRGMGGDPTKSKDRIENLIAVTRAEHITLGDKPEHMHYLYTKHLDFMLVNGVKFDMKFIQDKIDIYKKWKK